MKTLRNLLLSIFLLAFAVAALAEPLEGKLGNSSASASGWLNLRSPTDFQRGERLTILVGGTAKKILLRLLPVESDPSDPTGIDGGVMTVPDNRTIQMILQSQHRNVKQVSVHGGANPFGLMELGRDNGPATLVSIDRSTSDASSSSAGHNSPSSQSNGSFGGRAIILMNPIFAAKGNETDKEGFIRVQETGSYLPGERIRTQNLPAKNVSEIKVEFYAGHYANNYAAGSIIVEFYDDTQQVNRIDSVQFDIDNLIQDPANRLANWQIYKLPKYLSLYSRVINLSQPTTIASIKVWVMPGDWAVVIRDFKVYVKP